MRALLSALILLASIVPTAGAQSLRPRDVRAKSLVRAAPLPGSMAPATARRLTVKFQDGIQARVGEDGELFSRVGADLTAVRASASALGASFRPLIMTPESRLRDLEDRAAARSGRAQPDLAGIFIVDLPENTVTLLEAAGNSLQGLAEIEYAYIETLAPPPPGDIAPTTPNHVNLQGYRGSNPGLDFDFAWTQGLTGTGIRLTDCEYGWNPAHEDLVDRTLSTDPGQTVNPQVISLGWDSHGTAVVGITSGVVNAYGVSGLVPDADLATYTEWSVQQGVRRVTCVTNAIADSDAGDVVLLEMQTNGPGGDFAPAELNPSIWNVTRTGSDAGVIVVAAAGNGNQNLDSGPYSSYMAMGDSGAIIVGAGTANTFHHKLSFSTYGSRVNVQGWGGSVFTLGYGGFAQYGNDKEQRYTATFAGTSSASPFVASCCVALQQLSIDSTGSPLAPDELRQILIDTGRAQGSGGHIGPFPDMQAAIAVVPTNEPVTYCVGKVNSDICVPFITTVGFGSVTDTNPFNIRGNDIIANQSGLLVYGLTGRGNIPYHNAKLCVKAPLTRLLPPKNAGGAGGFCPGTLKVNFNKTIQGGAHPLLTAGQKVYAQFIYRDPGVDSFNDGLTDGVEFTIDP